MVSNVSVLHICVMEEVEDRGVSFSDADRQIELSTVQIRISANSEDDYDLNPIPTMILSQQSRF